MNPPAPADEIRDGLVRAFDPTADSLTDELLIALDGADAVDLATAEPLTSVIDPDALDRLVPPEAPTGVHVAFEYEGTRVEVSSDGVILVTPDPSPAAEPPG